MTTDAVLGTLGFPFRGPADPVGASPNVELISFYALTNGDPGDTQGGVDGTVVGTWTSTSTDSLVVGDAGTSIYKVGGTAHITLPASQAAHNLSELSLGLYYQPSASDNKHTLFAVGDGTQAGDFSIERLTNGRLRAWHVGQDAGLRFFESSAGIAATNLAVGTAYRVTLVLGPEGAKLYLNDTEVAGIAANTNGWNNARVKYIGIWTDGVQSPLQGAIDHIRIWSGELQASGVAALEAAQSITFPTAITVPSLATWLASDESDPTPTKYVSSQNRGTGDGSTAANAQELQAALTGASPGQTFLAVCQTPGTTEFWEYTSGLSFPNGSSGSPITLQARQGDGVVICRDNEFAGSRTPSSGFWTQSGLASSDIDKDIWVSSSTFSSGSTVRLYGIWIEFNHPHVLVPYNSLTELRAAYTTGATGSTSYGTPGAVLHTDGKVYIRMQKPHATKYSFNNKWQNHLWANNPEAINASGQLNYPISNDPNDYIIHLHRRSNTYAMPGAVWVKLGSGINTLGYRALATGSSANNCALRRGLHIVWYAALEDNTHHWDCQRTRFAQGSKTHASRAEWKFGGWLEGDRGAWYVPTGGGSPGNDIYCKDCTIADFHELAVGGSGFDSFRWRNCTIFNLTDEGLQILTQTTRIEIGYCYFLNASVRSGGASGDEADDPNPGNKFIHHNIIDERAVHGIEWGKEPLGHYVGANHSADHSTPWRIYNNIVFYHCDLETRQSTWFQHNANLANTLATAHEVFNNIIIRHDTQRHDNELFPGSITNFGPHDSVQDNIIFGGSSKEMWDYNLYYRDVPAPLENGLIRVTSAGGGSLSYINYNTLDLWRASANFNTSKAVYTPGFEANGTDTKPTLASLDNFPTDRFQYRPGATTAVTVSKTTSLSGANWWTTPPSWGADYFPWNDGAMTLAPSGWKGALDPNGVTIPVGVQDP